MKKAFILMGVLSELSGEYTDIFNANYVLGAGTSR